MGVITLPTSFTDGTVPTAAQFNGDFNAIVNELNGSISNANIASDAAIAESKVSFNTSTGHTHNGVDSRAIATDGWSDSSETWTYASNSDPTYTLTISGDKTTTYSAGMKVRLVDSGTKYFIITKVAYSAPNTTLTLYGGTDYDLTGGAITSGYYSNAKAPFGFPLDPTKWTVEDTDTANNNQSSPAADTWYNFGTVNITIPIGAWRVFYQVAGRVTKSGGANFFTTLSTANNSESDVDMTNYVQDTSNELISSVSREKDLVLTSSTQYFLNTKTSTSSVTTLGNNGNLSKTILRAVSKYL